MSRTRGLEGEGGLDQLAVRAFDLLLGADNGGNRFGGHDGSLDGFESLGVEAIVDVESDLAGLSSKGWEIVSAYEQPREDR